MLFSTESGVSQHNGVLWVGYLHDDRMTWEPFPDYWPFVIETIGHQLIPSQRADNAEF